MNFLDFDGTAESGSDAIQLNSASIKIPVLREGATGSLSLGVRPEHIQFSDGSAYSGKVIAIEYLGTTQIVTLSTANGDIKARTPSDRHVSMGQTIGLKFDARTLTVFENRKGLALHSAANEGVIAHG